MFAKSFIFVVLACGLAQGAITPFHNAFNQALKNKPIPILGNGVQADMSEWVDEILANVRLLMKEQGLETIPIPPITFSFEEKILGIVWHGEASMFDGYLKGLETMKRTGIAELDTDPETGDILISVEAGVNEGTLGAGLLVKFMNLGPTATITGTIKNIRVKLNIRAKVGIDGIVAQLDKFDITNLGILSIDVKGLGFILNFLVEITVDVVGNLIKGLVGELLQGPIKAIINQILKNPPPIPSASANYLMAVARHPYIIPRALPKHF